MKIAIIGYGKMGREIESICHNKGYSINLKINSQNTHLLNKHNLSKVDVAIDFSTPDVALNNILLCLNNNIPVVSGTTGWLKSLPIVKQTCQLQKGSFLHSSNFSIGMNIFIETLEKISALIQSSKYMIEIEEIHHNSKKDSPSGTALLIKDRINNHLAKTANIPIKSKRIGENYGEHKVIMSSKNETIQLSHKAHKRIGFAKGSILAAEFILNRTGFFTMKDLINNL
ncbi:MAG: 4-hydroxy-tetrahydrodipicolinate reductase [Flavobacteriales bacterium]|nr:4-hydroxy-tetrahydrodipicolinate reductase [Flavobacteriales bacterium]|tara:strand:+ start:17776 stop:18459 length:684 start_codon:yes stop_codon:yes gene_type:complete